MNRSSAKKARRIEYIIPILTICIFCLLLLLPNFIHLAQLGSDAAKYEKRNLEPFPPLGTRIKNYLRFPQRLEMYYNDHLGPRSVLIKMFSRWQYHLFGKSPLDKVTLGKDGWLFLNRDSGFDLIESYSGRDRFTQAELDRITDNLKAWQSWLADRNIKFYIMLPPNKSSVYTEFLPSSIIKLHPENRLDGLRKQLQARTDLCVLDLLDPLVGQKKDAQHSLFYKTDTHWTSLGAFIAYQEFMNVLKRDFPGVQTETMDDYLITESEMDGGDLANMMMLPEEFPDTQLYMNPKAGQKYRMLSDQPVWLPDKPIITSSENAGSPSGLIFRDSFFVFLQPFLSQNLRRAVYVWSSKLDARMIEDEKPDFVLLEIVERSLKELLKEPWPPSSSADAPRAIGQDKS